jgi:prophage antirepressor-like protein
LELRAVLKDGEPWFVAVDVCEALGTDTKDIRSILDSDEVCTVALGFRGRAPLIINESGLYSLILKSRKPEAKRFKKWVTSEVLPSIRKDGMYMTKQVAQEVVETPEMFFARALVIAQEKLTAQAVRLEGMDPAALHTMTVKEWARRNCPTLSVGQRVKLGALSSSIALASGRERQWVEVTVPTKYGHTTTAVWVCILECFRARDSFQNPLSLSAQENPEDALQGRPKPLQVVLAADPSGSNSLGL